jgi:hypothetical protein
MTGDDETRILELRTVDQACRSLKIGKSYFGKIRSYGWIGTVMLLGRIHVTVAEIERYRRKRDRARSKRAHR